ncbi:aldehyde dehydrogenase family protein [Pseudonocardia kujensis]|uniref:aldehyde dehydrogenase family protein n=1 Tax=Pseudonocardia kujensis TaxID=1128675 RepID=UPI001E434EFF|nr:aldehyde dehydrogenase family protein [Pseudonocardia kujensis]MCE0762022.1 aldehyde dehydrogenase family protein [Pseudonocardia kujensis]
MRTEAENQKRVSELLAREWRMLINGELVPAPEGRTLEVTSPFTEQVIASVPDATTDQVEEAVQRADAAFPEWRDRGPVARAELVRKLADVVEEHLDDLALLDAIDGGAQIRVMAGDVRAAATIARYFAGLALEIKGESVPATPTGVHFTSRMPWGVVAKIIPFNHPLLFAVRNIAAPLVAGNCVILKPSEITPLSALLLAELAKDVFPPGVFQIVLGNGPDVPRTLVRHPLINRIGFTGSEPTGQSILRDTADTGFKEVTVELGGKNALIAFPDADPAKVAAGAVKGMNFTWSGQSCGSTSRLLVHESIADQVLKEIGALLARHTIGSPLDPEMDQGPLVSKRQYEKVLDFIARATDDGAVVAAGGGRPAEHDTGYFIEPTILDNVDPASHVATEEIFGPVLSVIRWGDADDPVAIANSVRFGLTGSVYTNDLRVAHRTAQRLETGTVWINDAGPHYLGMPFGGFKSSGLGREESLDELLSYTQLKSIHILT